MTYVSSVLSFKEDGNTYNMTKFYEQDEDTVDVLILGSSHAFMDINPAVLWEEYGIAAYDLGNGNQQPWNSYYQLVEALKTQHPRLIILEAYYLFKHIDVDEYIVVSGNYGLKWSRNRIESIKASAPEGQFWSYLLTYNHIHGRYTDLTEADFRSNRGNPLYEDWKGYRNLTYTVAFDRPDVTGVTESTDLDNKSETYYRKILELAQESNIPIAVIASPYAGITDWEQAYFNRIAEIAAEYDVHFYNFNLDYDSYDLDFATDIPDSAHLNYLGAAKYSKYLGEILVRDYPEQYVDRRGDARYVSWERNANYYERSVYDLQIAQQKDIADAIAMANDENYTILLSMSGASDELTDSLGEMGINLDAQNGVWIIAGDTKASNRVGEFPYHIEPVKYDDILITNDGNTYHFLLDGDDYTTQEGGVNLLIYDQTTASVVTTLGM